MYIIFLDIDGVLNTEHGLKFWTNNWENPTNAFHLDGKQQFCPEAIEVLRKIIENTGAKIVISSTWKSNGLKWFKKFWKDRGLPGEIIDVTKNTTHRIRGVEVEQWLFSKGYYYPESYWDAPYWNDLRKKCKIKGYCIIDDDWDFLILQKNHYVNTPAYKGLASEGKYEEVIKALNSKPVEI